MGRRAYKYYTSTPHFVINKKDKKNIEKKKKRWEKHSEKIQYKEESIGLEAKYIQKHKQSQKHGH